MALTALKLMDNKRDHHRYALFLRFNTGGDFQEGQNPLRKVQWV